MREISQTPSGCLKVQIVRNPTHTVSFLYILMKKLIYKLDSVKINKYNQSWQL